MKKILYILIFTAISLYSSTIGKITALSGEVFIKSIDSTLKASLGYEFSKQDLIFTKDGKAQLTFKDNTVITLGKNSKLSIQEYLYSEKNVKKSKARFKFVKGIFRTITGAIGKANHKNFKIMTKNSTIGIRGTVFVVQVITPPNLKKIQTVVSVVEGSVVVQNNMGKFVVLHIGESIKVTPKGKFEKAPVISLHKKPQKKSTSKSKSKSNNKSKTKNETESGNKNKSKSKTETKTETKDNLQSNPPNSIKTQTIQENIEVADNNLAEVNSESEDGSPQEEKKVEEKPEETTHDNGKTPQIPEADVEFLDNLLTDQPDGTDTVKTYEDSYLSLGYWQKEDKSADSTWIEQKEITDPDTIIDDYISKGAKATYKGEVLAVENGNLANGDIELDFDFSKESVKGNMNFQSPGSPRWSMDIEGENSVYANGFSATLKDAEDSEIKNVTGEMKGNFLGNDAQAVGGAFNATDGSQNNVQGVFQGAKQ